MAFSLEGQYWPEIVLKKKQQPKTIKYYPTHCLLVSSAQNLCKKIGPRSGPTKCGAWSGSKLLGVSNKARLENWILSIASLDVIPTEKRIIKALISLCRCAGWYDLLLAKYMLFCYLQIFSRLTLRNTNSLELLHLCTFGYGKSKSIWLNSSGPWAEAAHRLYVGLNARKPVFRVSNKVRLKQPAQLQRLARKMKFPLSQI